MKGAEGISNNSSAFYPFCAGIFIKILAHPVFKM